MNKIKELRKAQLLTQKQLAEKIGLTDEAICQYEKGQRIPNVYILYKISKVLNCTMEDLIDKKVANE